MNKFIIPHDAWVFIGDGQKALFLRNDGDEKFLNLKTERVFAEDNRLLMSKAPTAPGARRRAREQIDAAAWR